MMKTHCTPTSLTGCSVSKLKKFFNVETIYIRLSLLYTGWDSGDETTVEIVILISDPSLECCQERLLNINTNSLRNPEPVRQ